MDQTTPTMVLADCTHMTEAVFVDGQWQTPQWCDECIVENAGRPLTDQQTQDFARVTEQLLRRVRNDSGGRSEDRS